MLKYSIIIPVYNVREYISKCIESVLNQSYTAFEAILVDDGSTDDSGDFCDEYALKDSRIKVIHKKNGGLVSARQEGLKNAIGDYIISLDSDDWIELNLLETINNIIKNYAPDVISFGFFRNGVSTETTIKQNIAEGFYDKKAMEEKIYTKMLYDDAQPFFDFGLAPNLCCKVCKRSILYDNQMAVNISIGLGEDAACTYPTVLQAESVYILHKHLYHYRYNEKSITNSYNPKMLENNELLIGYLDKQLGDKYNLSKQINYYSAFLIYLSVLNEAKNKKKSMLMRVKNLKANLFKEFWLKALNGLDYTALNKNKRIFFNLIRKKRFLILLIIIKIRYKL